VQFRKTVGDGADTKNLKRDVLKILFKGLDNINFGGKDMRMCLLKESNQNLSFLPNGFTKII
jgi:hypothetical protein